VGGFSEKCVSFVSQGGFSLTKKQIENKFSIWSLLFLPITDWQNCLRQPSKAPSLHPQRRLTINFLLVAMSDQKLLFSSSGYFL